MEKIRCLPWRDVTDTGQNTPLKKSRVIVESIYDFVPKAKTEIKYISKYRPMIVQEWKQVKKPMRTMGPAKVELSSPKNYLLKHSKEVPLPDIKLPTAKASMRTVRKPEVPLRTEMTVRGTAVKNNFITMNAMENIRAVARQPPPAAVDTKNGDKQVLGNLRLGPKYMKKKDFGQTPQYILRRTEEARKAREASDSYAEEMARQRRQQVEEQRRSAITELRQNWVDLNRKYLLLPLACDTLLRVNRRRWLEVEMDRVKKHIQLVDKGRL